MYVHDATWIADEALHHSEAPIWLVFSEGNMQAVAYDILWHGTVTMAGALQWALLFLLHYPDVQVCAQAEIDANFPEDTVPLTADVRQKLPYLEAVVLEVNTKRLKKCA